MPPLLKFTIEQDNYIKENCNKVSFKEIGSHLGISPSRIRIRAIEIEAFKPGNNTKITQYQKEYIKEHFGKMKTTDIANHLGLSRKTVRLNAIMENVVDIIKSTDLNFDNGNGYFDVDKYALVAY